MGNQICLSNATDDQLESIARYDKDCPTHLLSGVVNEMLNRGLFDSLIASCIRRAVHDVRNINRVYRTEIDDLMQIGRISVLKMVGVFEPGRGASFVSMAYAKTLGDIIKELQRINAKSRNPKHEISMHNQTDDDDEYENFLPDQSVNVERYVVNKLEVEHHLSKLNAYQKKVVLYRMQGYKFDEIAQLMGVRMGKFVSNTYNLSLKKMKGRVAG